MRAVIVRRLGPPEVLEVVDRPDPAPGPGQVLVDVDVAAVTFIDTQVRAGRSPRPLEPDELPFVPGNGVGGTVAAGGPEVDTSWLGQRVVTATGGRGGYATKALASAGDLHRLPAGVELTTAVALLADGRTAIGLARAAAIREGDAVMVTAAAGGVGSLLVQLARRAGARVVALAGGERKLEHARTLGADVAVDYREPAWPERVAAAVPGGLDVGFDGVGGATGRQVFELLRTGGRYLPHGAASGQWSDVTADEARRRGVSIVPLDAVAATPSEQHALVEEALAAAAAGWLRPTIGQTWPLKQAAAAHAAIEARATLGKTVLLTS